MGIAQIGLTVVRGPFFRPSKTTFRRVLKNQILIENDDENDDDNGDA